MALDTRYIPLFNLQEWFVDKNDGEPLAAGIVSFYQDNSRSTPKAVYELVSTGTPPSYSYASLGSQLILSDVGTFVDPDGNDIAPYLYPYDSDGDVELYYIVVQGSAGSASPQFTREAVPNLDSSSSGGDDPNLVNHVPNGQFQLHNDYIPIPGAVTLDYGTTRGNVSVSSVAPGGIYFERSVGSVATDAISFVLNDTYFGGFVTASPRYSCRIVRSVGANDAVCGLVFRFMDVWKFSSPSSTPQLSFVFNGRLTAAGTLNSVGVNQIQYFGTSLSTGGSAGSTTIISPLTSSLTFTAAEKQFAVSFSYVPSDLTTVGTDNNDFVEFEIALPPNQTWDVQIDDVMLLNGTFTTQTLIDQNTLFPELTNGQFLLEALSNVAPTTRLTSTSGYYAYDGSDLYLPMLKTRDGWTYDYSVLGQITASIYTAANAANYPVLLCDGSAYVVNSSTTSSNYSSLGIPYSRLQTVLLNNSPVSNVPMYGTGSAFATAYALNGSTSQVRLVVNKTGVAAVAAAGTSGFTVTTVHTGAATINYSAYSNIANTVLAVGTFTTPLGGVDAAAGTSGFTITINNIRTGLLADQFYSFRILTIAGAGLAGLYFTFRNAATAYYMWFTVGGAGADPAPGGTGVQVNLKATDTAQDVANAVRETLNQYQSSLLVIGSAPTAGQYFTFQTNPGSVVNYYVWYYVNSVGPDPAPGGTGIRVAISSSDTAAQITTKTIQAINAYQFAVPSLQGMFLRGLDPSATYDLDVAQRWSTVSALSGANLATFEFEQFLSHAHTANRAAASAAGIVGSWQVTGTNTLAATAGSDAIIVNEGGSEVRPVNAAVNWFIRY